MNAALLLCRLCDLGVTAEARGERLALRPASLVPPDLLAALQAHKAEVLALLAAHAATTLPTLPPASPEQAAAEAAEGDAVRAVKADPDRYRPNEPQQAADDFQRLVERLADAMARKPGVRIIEPEKARAYLLSEARRRLERLGPMARALLVQAEEAQKRTRTAPIA